MKFILSLSRALFIFFVWTIGYFFWFQQLMIAMWHFNPFNRLHWQFIQQQWQAGWTITSTREWLFVLLLFAVIPVWLTGWAILSTVSWTKWFKIILMFPIRLIQKELKKRKTAKMQHIKPKVTKKKSYKQTRPAAVRAGSGKIKQIEKAPEPEKAKEKPHTSHTPAPEPAPAPAKKSSSKPATSSSGSGSSIADTLRSAGYKLIADSKIAGKNVDFLGISADHLLLCLVDSENGDWLADEERFNDEEPLWFSESNHRISPVRVILNARDALLPMLSGSARGMEIKPMVIVRQGTIINAEDMFDVWENLKVTVCRYDDGGPDEIATLNASLSKVGSPDDTVVRDISGLVS